LRRRGDGFRSGLIIIRRDGGVGREGGGDGGDVVEDGVPLVEEVGEGVAVGSEAPDGMQHGRA
jgi:hypothetical protein